MCMCRTLEIKSFCSESRSTVFGKRNREKVEKAQVLGRKKFYYGKMSNQISVVESYRVLYVNHYPKCCLYPTLDLG